MILEMKFQTSAGDAQITTKMLYNKLFNNTATALALTTPISTNCGLTSRITNTLKNVIMCSQNPLDNYPSNASKIFVNSKAGKMVNFVV